MERGVQCSDGPEWSLMLIKKEQRKRKRYYNIMNNISSFCGFVDDLKKSLELF